MLQQDKKVQWKSPPLFSLDRDFFFPVVTSVNSLFRILIETKCVLMNIYSFPIFYFEKFQTYRKLQV